ncbi:hypothetical protein [Vitiosangium sp. GDMCC 1.1324]|uniref:hypothetical protein n=1 Tax=Vitiosangium sp. (strain GDMCC 1.1324) TaxID=2138576 RepID=UPI000D3D3524|nr:hypothetical protein [Vitiosangium sp. GDMCC 1.1324]PTL81883.1 hypothetical protein DAT35_22875 [Vitiosangium sp. GDMCC 1.1324]
MTLGQPSSLQLPSFLYGTYSAVQQKTREEGLRCGEQYRKDSSFPAPRHMQEVHPGEVVVTHGVADFQHEHPAWRLYMVSDVMSALWEALEEQNSITLRDAYEEFFRETAWGALYFTIEQMGPVSAERTASRLQAVLRFWAPLQSARYLFKTLAAALTLEELMVASCGWAMDAWCPEGNASVRERLEMAAERMARATREDSIKAILRQMPRALTSTSTRGLKRRAVVADPSFQREHLATLDPRVFERVSGARTGDLIWLLHNWDYELEMQ